MTRAPAHITPGLYIHKTMRATTQYVEQKYQEFNLLIFGGKLPMLPFVISHARTYLGQIRFRRNRKSGVCDDFKFVVSDRLDLPQDTVDDIIIHEMIHFHILCNGLKDTAPHGRIFRKFMADINRLHGRHITVTHRATQQENASDTRRTTHLICLSTFRDGTKAITVLGNGSKTLFAIWDEIARAKQIKEWTWICSTDPFFNSIRHSLTLKFYTVPTEQLRPRLCNVRRLVRQGDTIILGPAADLSTWVD